jgi:hypothetical protein
MFLGRRVEKGLGIGLRAVGEDVRFCVGIEREEWKGGFEKM